MNLSLFLPDLKIILEELSFRNVIDLILVWLVVYRILLFTKSSGSLQVVLGITFIGLIYALSILFELITFNWLLEALFSQLILIVVILFQKEIRQALIQIGSKQVFSSSRGISSIKEGSIVDELSKGLIQLSQRAVGALVVIEKDMALDHYIETGVKLECNIRAEMLLAIFNSRSPTHDGAILIRDNRISYSGCFLPLSNNPALDKTLGTRHRAALGLSEETDAIILLVSEEKKAVIYVEKGKFSSPMDHVDLRKKLYDIFTVKKG